MSDFYEYEYKDGEKMLEYMEKMAKKNRRKNKRKEPTPDEYYHFETEEEKEKAWDDIDRKVDEYFENGGDLLGGMNLVDDEITKITGMTKKERVKWRKIIDKFIDQRLEQIRQQELKTLSGKKI